MQPKKGRTNVIKNPFAVPGPQDARSPDYQYNDPYVREEPPFPRASSGHSDFKPKPFYPSDEAFNGTSFAPSPFPQEGPAEAKGAMHSQDHSAPVEDPPLLEGSVNLRSLNNVNNRRHWDRCGLRETKAAKHHEPAQDR